MAKALTAPFPYFGGKARVAPIVWRALGPDVPRYVEPFAGSLAVLLARPRARAHPYEIVNDADGLVVNFWRAIRSRPADVHAAMDWMPSQADLYARMNVLRSADLVPKLVDDPRWCDPELAGWWAWAMSCRIVPSYQGGDNLDLRSRLGVTSNSRADLVGLCRALAARLARVRVHCGSWERVVSDTVLMPTTSTTAGVFLDPPYDNAIRSGNLYGSDDGSVAADVRRWCIENGDRRGLRIVLAGYEAEHDTEIPDSWGRVRWSTDSVMGGSSSTENRANEVLWLSPGCRPIGG